jgi:S1-C subfamily serine protease
LSEVQGQRAQGIGFAIPIRRVLEALSDIFPTEFVKAYWFGARVKVGTTPLVIMSVQAQSPAGQAGLKTGDAILQVNGKAPRSFIDFTDLLAARAGSEVTLAIRRGAARKDISVRLVPEKSVFNAGMIRDKLGLSLEELTPQLAARYGLGASDAFLVTGVQSDSPAAGAGLQGGILVTAIDGQLPADLSAAAKLLYAKKKGDPVQLGIAFQQRMGNFNVLRQGAVELATR